MTQFTKVRARTTNQPSSRFSWSFPLTRDAISQVLGYNPEGETVAKVLDTLQSGRGVQIYTKQVPRERGTNVVALQLLPLRESDDPALIPECPVVEF